MAGDGADSMIAVIGSTGMVGSALVRALGDRAQVLQREDLRHRGDTAVLLSHLAEGVITVIIAAARVGGIMANVQEPGQFIFDNLAIGMNLIEELRHQRPQIKIVYLGSSCVYPRDARQPIKEDSLGTGKLEPTNEPYAVAKIACIKMLEAYGRQYGTRYLVPMPCNLYGPGDHYDEKRSHLIPALIRKMHAAKIEGAESVTLWGSGTPRRECMHVDDLAAAVLYLIGCEASGIVNVGTGHDDEIAAIAALVAHTVGYRGRIEWDRTEPDGTPRKLLDVGRMHYMGWDNARSLTEGLKDTYAAYLRESKQGVAA